MEQAAAHLAECCHRVQQGRGGLGLSVWFLLLGLVMGFLFLSFFSKKNLLKLKIDHLVVPCIINTIGMLKSAVRSTAVS